MRPDEPIDVEFHEVGRPEQVPDEAQQVDASPVAEPEREPWDEQPSGRPFVRVFELGGSGRGFLLGCLGLLLVVCLLLALGIDQLVSGSVGLGFVLIVAAIAAPAILIRLAWWRKVRQLRRMIRGR